MDQLSPSRPAKNPRAENAASPKAAPKADPLPGPAPTAEVAPKPSWRTRLLMFGLPLALIAGDAGWWLTSGGSVSTDKAYVQMDKVSDAAAVGRRLPEVAITDGHQVAKRSEERPVRK